MNRTLYKITSVLFAFSGEGGAGPERRQSAGNREVLSITTSEYPDAVGTARTADPVERNRPDSAPADVQLTESYFAGETTANSALGLRGRG